MRLPDHVIIPINASIAEIRKELEADWLFTIDYECILALIIEYIYDLGALASQYTLTEHVLRSFELKARMSPRQETVIINCIERLGQHLVRHLNQLGLVEEYDEYVSARLCRLLPDGTIVLKFEVIDIDAVRI